MCAFAFPISTVPRSVRWGATDLCETLRLYSRPDNGEEAVACDDGGVPNFDRIRWLNTGVERSVAPPRGLLEARH